VPFIWDALCWSAMEGATRPMATGPLPSTMRAWVLQRYGPPDALALEEVPLPAFRDEKELLVRVFASSVNPADRHNLHPSVLLRRRRGLLRPKEGYVGLDLAGRVERVGREVTDVQVGDEVFGVGRGAFGQFAVADRSEVARKPTGVSWTQAAALPIAAVTALQGLRDKAAVRAGQKVLVNGASGGVGTYAVQIARALGAEVSCVCSPPNVAWARSMGVSRVFDYTREDFAASGERYDLVFDTQLNHSLADYRRVLVPGGLLLAVGAGPGTAGRLLLRLLKVLLGARLAGPKVKFFVAQVRTKDLEYLADLLTAGKVIPAIDRTYPLEQVPDALRYLIEGHARGKIILEIASPVAATPASPN
jgi:NADPH:quinone reductase-like Zn-dependent oxidoreductase